MLWIPGCEVSGIGFQMVAESLSLAEQKGAVNSFLEVRQSNSSAINIYHKSGFQIIGKRPGIILKPKKMLWSL